MSKNSRFDEAMQEARAAREAHEAGTAFRNAEAERERKDQENANGLLRQQLREIGSEFRARARKSGVKPDSVRVAVGSRDRYKGLVFRKRVGADVVYQRRKVWTVLPFRSGSGYSSDHGHNGIYVLDDGQIIGSLALANVLPHGNVEEVKRALARYLVDRERR
jgi:hypothetical protein